MAKNKTKDAAPEEPTVPVDPVEPVVEPTPEPAPAPVRKPRAARIASPTAPQAIIHPRIIAGKCEFCGEDYQTCQHYAGMDVFCSYCNVAGEVFNARVINVYSLPESPDVYIFVCADFKCQAAHQKKFVSEAATR